MFMYTAALLLTFRSMQPGMHLPRLWQIPIGIITPGVPELFLLGKVAILGAVAAAALLVMSVVQNRMCCVEKLVRRQWQSFSSGHTTPSG